MSAPSEAKNTLGQALRSAKARLAAAGREDAAQAARLLVAWATDSDAKNVLLAPEKTFSQTAYGRLEAAIERCAAGESIHRIMGKREFYGLAFHLSAATLEPRPDTETLVDLLLPHIRQLTCQQHTISLLDMGTGSGAIAVALLAEVPQLTAVGVDIAADALEMAARNARNAGVDARFTPLKSDWFAQVDGLYQVIVSNPPYIRAADIARLDKMVRDFDPILALDGGTDGLDFYRRLARESGRFLRPDGLIGVEIGQHQEKDVTALFAAQNYRLREAKRDLGGIMRALLFQQNPDHFS